MNKSRSTFLTIVLLIFAALSVGAFDAQTGWINPQGCKDKKDVPLRAECKDISGLARLSDKDKTTFIAVRGKEGTLGKITVKSGSFTWELINLPSDISGLDMESISAIPGRDGEFIIVSVYGSAFHATFKNDNAGKLITSFKKIITLPGYENRNFTEIEGVAVQQIGKEFVIMWATRGQNDIKSKLFVAKLGFDNFDNKSEVTVTDIPDIQKDYSEFSAPQKDLQKQSKNITNDIRHVSDIKIDSRGNVFVSSTNDTGDKGPFNSAVYWIGKIDIKDNNYAFIPRTSRLDQQIMPSRIAFYNSTQVLSNKKEFEVLATTTKIEALEILEDGKFVFGTDDEDYAAKLMVGYSATIPEWLSPKS